MFSKKQKVQDDKFYEITSFLTKVENDSPPSIINSGSSINGNLNFEFAEIMGSVEGNIRANFLHIRSGGNVTGNILADHVQISGSFKGNIKARIVTLYQSSSIEAEIEYAYLIVNDGVVLNGNCIYNESLKQSPEQTILNIIK